MQSSEPGVPIDLGHVLMAFLLFYSCPDHFDVSSHAIDLCSSTAFVSKATLQGHLDPAVRAELAQRLCALEPSLRHDIGANIFRITQCLTLLHELREQLVARGATAQPTAAEVQSLLVRCSSSTLDPALVCCHACSCLCLSLWRKPDNGVCLPLLVPIKNYLQFEARALLSYQMTRNDTMQVKDLVHFSVRVPFA
jgi:hypothetical protein